MREPREVQLDDLVHGETYRVFVAEPGKLLSTQLVGRFVELVATRSTDGSLRWTIELQTRSGALWSIPTHSIRRIEQPRRTRKP